MTILFINKMILRCKGNELTPKDLRQRIGQLTKSNETIEELIEGTNRQWNRFNDPKFQLKELKETMENIFPNDKSN